MEEKKYKQPEINKENELNIINKESEEQKIIKEKKRISYFNSLDKKRPIFDILKLKEKDFNNFENIFEEFQELYKVYKSRIKKLDNNIEKKKENIDINQIIQKLRIKPEKRTMDDIYLIRKYIKKTKIESLFYNEINIKGKLYNTCLLFISFLIKFKYLKKNEVIFRIGEIPDFLYLIMDGKINVLKPIAKIKSLTGFEYFLQLMKYRKNKDKYLYSLCIQENTINYEIRKKDKNLIPYIYLTYRLDEIKKRIFINFKNVFELIGISPIDLGLNPSKVHSISYIYKYINEIKSRMPPITREELKLYEFIDNKELKKDVTIFEYESFLTMNKNEYFGDNAYIKKDLRNATIKTEENCCLGYVNIELYGINFYKEKKNIHEKKINFLYTNFFFQKISLRKFDKRYFNFFISENYLNNDFIYNENSASNYVYFIEEGTVELTSTKSIIEIQLLLKGLKEKETQIKQKCDYDKINSSWNEIQNYVIKKQMNKLLVLGKKNVLGLESFFYQIPYLTNARVISPTAKIIKIDREHLYQILIRSNECINDLKTKVQNTLKILTHRLFGINNNKLKRIDNLINLDNILKLEKLETDIQPESKLKQKNPFVHSSIKIIKPIIKRKIPLLISTSTDAKNISNNTLINKKPVLKSALYKKRDYFKFYKKRKLASNLLEKKILKNIKKEMISLKKRKFCSIVNYNINDNNNEKNNVEEKTEPMNKLNTVLKKYEENFHMTNNNNNDTFEFVTKLDNINPSNIFENIKIKENFIIKEYNENKTRNKYLPRIIINNSNQIGKNSFLSIISKSPNIDNSTKNINKLTKDLNINFSYNNHVIKNYSFINRYIYKDKEKIKIDIDPKDKYKIFDNYSKIINKSKSKEKDEFIKIKKYVPKSIRSQTFIVKIKKYQEYRKKIQKRIEEMTS